MRIILRTSIDVFICNLGLRFEGLFWKGYILKGQIVFEGHRRLQFWTLHKSLQAWEFGYFGGETVEVREPLPPHLPKILYFPKMDHAACNPCCVCTRASDISQVHVGCPCNLAWNSGILYTSFNARSTWVLSGSFSCSPFSIEVCVLLANVWWNINTSRIETRTFFYLVMINITCMDVDFFISDYVVLPTVVLVECRVVINTWRCIVV